MLPALGSLSKQKATTGACLLGAFRYLGKATIIFVMSVRLSAWNNSAPIRRIFIKFHIWATFRKSVEEIRVSTKSDKSNRHFTSKTTKHFFITSRSILLRMRKVVEEIKTHQNTHFVFSNSPPENNDFYEIMWKHSVQRRSQMAIWRMRIACRITKATNTHSQYVTPLTAFPPQQWLPEHSSRLRHTYCTLPVLYCTFHTCCCYSSCVSITITLVTWKYKWR